MVNLGSFWAEIQVGAELMQGLGIEQKLPPFFRLERINAFVEDL